MGSCQVSHLALPAPSDGAQAQNTTDDNARIFAQWRARNGLTLAAAALALEMTPRTMSAYGTGAALCGPGLQGLGA